MGVLLPRGGILSVGILELLAIDLEENEPALLTVTALWRGRGERLAWGWRNRVRRVGEERTVAVSAWTEL